MGQDDSGTGTVFSSANASRDDGGTTKLATIIAWARSLPRLRRGHEESQRVLAIIGCHAFVPLRAFVSTPWRGKLSVSSSDPEYEEEIGSFLLHLGDGIVHMRRRGGPNSFGYRQGGTLNVRPDHSRHCCRRPGSDYFHHVQRPGRQKTR